MAKQMPYDDTSGNHYNTSYWRIVQINMSIADRSAMVTLYGYKDSGSRLANKTPITGAIKSYSIAGNTFDALMAKHLAAGGPNIMKLIYDEVVTKTKDVIVDPNDPTKNIGFFDAATDLP